MSISAREWVNLSTVDAAIVERWPEYRAILLATDDVDFDGLAATADLLIDQAAAAALRADQSEPSAHVARWHAAYRDFGVKPRVARVSVDALTRRAASEAGLPRINVLVDMYNAISVLHGVPIGGEDLDRYDGPAHLVLAVGDEPFHTRADGEPVIDHPDPGEPVWVDAGGVTCRRWNWRQTTRTAIDQHTTRVGFIIDSLDAPNHNDAERVAEQLAELVPNVHARTVVRG